MADSSYGKVYLVGAGPGDPGLLTLRGAELLARADLVLYDYLANPVLLEHAHPEAEQICLGQHGRGRIWTQQEINARMIQAAQAGRTVLRLKSGDPAVFGRLAEEMEVLAENGLEFEVVPGVTAALAAASYAGLAATHRDFASAVALVTGHECAGKTSSALDYAALAKFPGTLVFYMGVTSAPQWAHQLIAAGKAPETAVTIVRRCSLPDQQTWTTSLAGLGETVQQGKIRPPVVFVVGPAESRAGQLNWFANRPLFGRRILVTRAETQAEELAHPLRELGADVLCQPAIRIGPPRDVGPLDQVLQRLTDFHWIVFSSANGVQRFFDRLWRQGRDLRALGGAKLAVIGPATAAALERLRLRPDAMPEEFRAEALAQHLAPRVRGERVLLVRASRGREVLAEELVRAGAGVEQVTAYQSEDIAFPSPEIAAAMEQGAITWTTVTSSAIARSLVRLFGESLRKTELVSISPITSATLAELGYSASAEATEYTMPGVLQAILHAEQ